MEVAFRQGQSETGNESFIFLATKVVVKKNTFAVVRTVKEFLKQSMDVIHSQLRA
ncbi:MAG: hypothetical protein LBF68_06565 [Christensenellaceae bacterium]|jgi:hypothetical protein|nr:hypothetical protein [Christensenellaceae bacterium]